MGNNCACVAKEVVEKRLTEHEDAVKQEGGLNSFAGWKGLECTGDLSQRHGLVTISFLNAPRCLFFMLREEFKLSQEALKDLDPWFCLR